MKKNYKLLVCDLDNTLVKGPTISSWQSIWEFLDADAETRKYGLRQYQSGAFSYSDWCAHDTKTFREYQLRKDHFSEICRHMQPSPNLREALTSLKEHGIRMAICSGAIDMILHTALPWYNEFFDDVHVNRSQFCEDGFLLNIEPTPYDFDGKFHCVEMLCEKYGYSLEEAVFVGDGPNDMSVVGKVGLTIAFGSTTDEVKESFDVDLPGDDFRDILEYLSPK